MPQALGLWNKGGICQLHKACKSYLYLTNCILLMHLKIEEGVCLSCFFCLWNLQEKKNWKEQNILEQCITHDRTSVGGPVKLAKTGGGGKCRF